MARTSFLESLALSNHSEHEASLSPNRFIVFRLKDFSTGDQFLSTSSHHKYRTCLLLEYVSDPGSRSLVAAKPYREAS